MLRMARPLLGAGGAVAIWLLAGELAAPVISALSPAQCEARGMFTHCVLPAAEGIDIPTHLAMLAVTVVAAAFVVMFMWERVAAPFLLFQLVLFGFCLVFDVLVGKPISNASLIFSDTLNILGVVILLSFFFAIAIGIGTPLSLTVAAIASHTARLLSFAAFAWLQPHFPGASGMFLLFTMYAFGTFTLHVMSISVLAARTSHQLR